MKRVVLSVAAAGGFLALAFGSAGGDMSMGGGAGAGNADACKAYVDAYNAASCLGAGPAGKMDVAVMCPSELDMSPKDMKPYYKCLSDAISCNGEIPTPEYGEKAAACTPM
jgi:hypothetical protein